MKSRVTIELSNADMRRLAVLLADAAAAAGDDGREGCADEMLLWTVHNAVACASEKVLVK